MKKVPAEMNDSPLLHINIQRRSLLKTLLGAASLGAVPLLSQLGYAQTRFKRAPRILLRSSWQVVNIGDVAHTPGVLALLEKHIPEAEVILWASKDLSDEVAAMEHRRFPKLKIVKGTIGADGCANNAELAEALSWCDFLLHGSGPSLVAAKDVEAFQRYIKKPFGVYCITYGGASNEQRELMSAAEFVYFRDSVSLEKAKSDGINSKVMEFAPDGAFAVDLRSDDFAARFLEQNQLEQGKFVCCIPRLRNTPYWKIRKQTMTEVDNAKDARNQAMEQSDHQPLRDAIVEIIKRTDLKVLLCPEDMSQMEVGKRLIYDTLPANVQQRVVWREKFWLTDEALSTYIRSAGLFGLEMHSPIMCIGNGIPAIVGRFAEQTSKGFMWRDIGLGEWLFDFDDADSKSKYVEAVIKMLTDRQASMDKVAKAQQIVRDHQEKTMKRLSSVLQEVI